MDFFRNDELLPVWNHDDDEYNNQTGIHNNTFENFWSITGNATSEEDNSASDAMFVDGSQDNYNEYSSSSESFSASTEDFPQQQIQYQTQQDQQAQQQFQLEQHQLHIQHQLQQQHLHIQQQLQLQQLQLQQQQQQHLQYQQTQFVPMTYQYVPQQQQYYAVDPSYLQTPNVNTAMVPQQSSSPIEYYQQPQQISNLSSSSENYEDDVQYDNAYEEDDDQYDTPYEEKSTGYGTPSSPASEIPQAAFVGNMDVDSDPVDFKLPASKTPIMEAMVVCALNGWGLTVVKSYANEVVFRVTDFDRYYRVSRAICSKHRPTEDVGSRVKTLRRWFVNFPKKKDRQDTPSFLLSVKPNTCKKVHGIIERNVKLMTGSKRSSR